MSNQYLLIYNSLDNTLFSNKGLIHNYDYETRSGDKLIFSISSQGLTLDVPFFLLDNIFYIKVNNYFYFSSNIDSLSSYTSVSIEQNQILNKYGFLPHSRTQFENIEIVCSFLTYTFNKSGISILLSFYHNIDLTRSYNVDDLMGVFRRIFCNNLEKVNNKKLILPLSGGMDSRLLLSLAIEQKDTSLSLFTLGTQACGDIHIAKSIAKSFGLDDKHKFLFLENLTKRDILLNYRKIDYLLPLDRILNAPLQNYFDSGVVLSGLYGDVIFSDNENYTLSYDSYFINSGFKIVNQTEADIVNAYNNLPNFPKLHRTLLRCQKLTRQSIPLTDGFKFVTPFVDPDVIILSSLISEKNIYTKIVKNHMNSKLCSFIHQTTLSYFTHPIIIRKFERRLFTMFRHPARFPYFDDVLLSEMNILRNETPNPKSF